jgi:hypothetical protein
MGTTPSETAQKASYLTPAQYYAEELLIELAQLVDRFDELRRDAGMEHRPSKTMKARQLISKCRNEL